jgi:hypothetical protein
MITMYRSYGCLSANRRVGIALSINRFILIGFTMVGEPLYLFLLGRLFLYGFGFLCALFACDGFKSPFVRASLQLD